MIGKINDITLTTCKWFDTKQKLQKRLKANPQGQIAYLK